jgi:predicted ribosome quality control (RQC) complex YloA/Tae2 family protein
MIKNYFILNRFIIEAGELLIGKSIFDIFSQEKDKLLIEFGTSESTKFLEICVNPGEPFINIREKYSRAKSNTINFFKDFNNKKIDTIGIADDDRIIKIGAQNSSLYFTIRGKYTNVICVNSNNEVEVFKKLDDEKIDSLKQELLEKTYIQQFSIPNLSIDKSVDYLNDVKSKYLFIGNEIIKEVKLRQSSKQRNNYQQTLEIVLNEIRDAKPGVFIDNEISEVHLAVETFKSFDYQEIKTFNDIISAQTFYLSKKYFLSEKGKKLKIIQKQLDRELQKVSNKMNKLQGVRDRGSKEEEYKNIGSLLLLNLKKLKTGMEKIILHDASDPDKEYNVKLNSKLLPNKNVDFYFDKAKAEKINYKKSIELLEVAKKDFERLKSIEQRAATIEDIKELRDIFKELKIKMPSDKKEKEDISAKFKHYVIEGKYNVYVGKDSKNNYVGKDSKNNDLLTTRFAKQNDYWFHARSVSGSHVVLRVENTKEAVPKNILKKTASLAAYHSKAKTAGVVPVAYTLKKYVVKKKAMPVGTVHLLKEDVLLVKPKIPNECEYIMDE